VALLLHRQVPGSYRVLALAPDLKKVGDARGPWADGGQPEMRKAPDWWG